MNRTWKTSEKIIISIAFLVIIFVVVGVTYAFFSLNIVGNDTATKTKVNTGLLNIDFVADEYFDNDDMMLIDDNDRETKAEIINFSVGHMPNATTPAKYLIYINEIIITDNFKMPDFKWELLKDNTVVSSGNFGSVINTELLLTPSQVSLPLGTTHNYELRVWLSDKDENQLHLLEGQFKGKVSVVAVAST